MSVITARFSSVHPVTRQPTDIFDLQYNLQPECRSRSYLKEAEVEYIQMLEDAVDEVKQLIEEVNRLSSDIIQKTPG